MLTVRSGSGAMPDFLILGAMKAGTTSVYHYLRQHPEVYMSPRKEPAFFALVDGRERWGGPLEATRRPDGIRTFEQYRALFAGRTDEKVAGEATTLYLYDEWAAEKIARYASEALLVAILRQPADRAYSAYLMNLRGGKETLSFEEALTAEPRRIAENWGQQYHYVQKGLYAKQLERYLRLFEPARLKVLFFEDLARDPASFLVELFRFLGVRDDFEVDVGERHNRARITRLPAAENWLTTPSPTRSALKRLLPGGSSRRLWEAAMAVNRRLNWVKPPTMRPETRRRLNDRFADDVRRVEAITGRDLGHWLET